MTMSTRTRWAGLSALLGGALAVLLTLPLGLAYDEAYALPGEDPPGWALAVKPLLGQLLTFDAPSTVYETYGRVFAMVYLLMLPGAVALHRLQRHAGIRFEFAGYVVLLAGLVLSGIGVAGDYWADGATFLVSVVGLLILFVGSLLYGIVTLRARILPRVCAWLMILAGAGGLPFTVLAWQHIPGGPTLLVACAFILVGYILWRGDGTVVRYPSQEA
jgi:hypothetical protein